MRGKKLWGGVFSHGVDKSVSQRLRKFLDSFRFDVRLVKEDFDITLVHAMALSDAGILKKEKVKEIFRKRDKIISSVISLALRKPEEFEDVHSALEYFISKEVGKETGFNLRAGRSRNDEVITSLYLWVLRSSLELLSDLEETFSSVIECAERNFGKIIPFYTHLKRAQPVLFSHLVLSYAVGFMRCVERFYDSLRRFDVCHLGSGAGVGTGIPINPKKMARVLGFSRVSENSIDSTGRRDNISEVIFVLTTFMILFSRFAEDMIFLSSDEVGMVQLGEEICTGSSMMPQKKNPDTLELIRGKASKFIGGLISILTLEKSLPFGYSKDLQEDKLILFELWDEFSDVLFAVSRAFKNIDVAEGLEDPLRRAGENTDVEIDNFFDDILPLIATDIAEELTLKGKSYKEAHFKVGKTVRDRKPPPFVISFYDSVMRKKTPQSTSETHVRRNLAQIKKKGVSQIKRMRSFLKKFGEDEFLRRFSALL